MKAIFEMGSNQNMYFLFDVGGTKLRMAVSADGATLGSHRIFPTPSTFAEGLALLKQEAVEMSRGERIKIIVGGLAGSFNRDKSVLTSGKNIADWVGKPLKQELERHFGARVLLENDAALSGLGEAIYGAGKGKEIVAYLTVSTGVGGARIVKGVIDPSAMGFEPGYQIIDAGKSLCKGYNARRLGALISGGALAKRLGKPAEQIDDISVWEQSAEFLAIGLNNVIVHWSPDVVILGGAVMQSIPLDRVRAHLASTLKPYPLPPTIARAELGDLGGLWGGLALAG